MFIDLRPLIDHLVDPHPDESTESVFHEVFKMDEHIWTEDDDATVVKTIELLRTIDDRRGVYDHVCRVAQRLEALDAAFSALARTKIVAIANHTSTVQDWDETNEDWRWVENPFPANIHPEHYIGWAYYRRDQTDRAYQSARVLVQLGVTQPMPRQEFEMNVLLPFITTLNSFAFGGEVSVNEYESVAEIDLWLMGTNYQVPTPHKFN
jgi:transposase